MTHNKGAWCYAADGYGEIWLPADSRATAIREGTISAISHGKAEVHIGQTHWASHVQLVSGIGDEVLDRLTEKACEIGGDLGEDYPDVGLAFSGAVESFLLKYLNENVEDPRFFTVVGEESWPVGSQENTEP